MTHQFADAHLAAWCKEREVDPWPFIDGAGSASATDLFNAYSQALDEQGLRSITLSTFSKGLVELGYEPRKAIEANVYPDLDVLTRRERAMRHALRKRLEPFYRELIAAEKRAHMERVPHVEVVKREKYAGKWAEAYEVLVELPVDCRHPIPDSVHEAIGEKGEVRRRELLASGVIDEDVERWFGYYLNGHPFPHDAYVADRAVEVIDDVMVRLKDLREERAEKAGVWRDARDEYFARFHSDPRRVNGSFVNRDMEELSDAYHDGEREEDRIDRDIARLVEEGEEAQRTLRQALRVLDGLPEVARTAGDDHSSEPTDEVGEPVW